MMQNKYDFYILSRIVHQSIKLQLSNNLEAMIQYTVTLKRSKKPFFKIIIARNKFKNNWYVLPSPISVLGCPRFTLYSTKQPKASLSNISIFITKPVSSSAKSIFQHQKRYTFILSFPLPFLCAPLQ